MGKAETWSSDEREGAAKAFIDSALDEARGAEQRGEEFAAAAHENFKFHSPPGVAGAGAWHDRDPDGSASKIWNCIRDPVLKDVQRFHRTSNAVLNVGPSGLTHEEKVNIAVATFLKRVKEGTARCQCKSLDANKWRLFEAHLVLKGAGKLAEPTAAAKPTEEIAATENSTDDADGNEGFMTDSSNLKPTTRGKNFQGRDAAKHSQLQEEHMKRKTAALEAFAGTEAKKLKVMEDTKTQVHTQNVIAMLGHPSIAGNRHMTKKLTKSVLVSWGLCTSKKNIASEEHPVADSTPGDLLRGSDENEEEANEDPDENPDHDSSSLDRPVTDEARASCDAGMARGAALFNRRFPNGHPVWALASI